MAKEVEKFEFTTSTGAKVMEKWNMSQEELEKYTVLTSNWASKQKPSNPHFGLSPGFQLEMCIKRPHLVKYKVGAVPVLDADLAVEDILDTYKKAYGLEVKKIATSRTQISTMDKKIANAVKDNPEMMAQIQAILDANPAMKE